MARGEARREESARSLRRLGPSDRDLRPSSLRLDIELLEILVESVERLHCRAVESARELGESSPTARGDPSSDAMLAADLLFARDVVGAAAHDELESILISSIMSAEGLLTELRQILSVARVVLESLCS